MYLIYGGFNCGNQFQFIFICFRLCWWVEEKFKKKFKSQIGKCWKRGKTGMTKLLLVLVSNSDWLRGCRGFFETNQSASKAKPKKSQITLNTQLKCPSLVFWQNNPEEGKLSSSSVNKALAELITVDLLKR